jgi:nitroreductase
MSHASPIVNTRQADYPIDAQFTARWSPRAYTGEAVAEADIMRMLEAARWAPSSNNAQPWRFAIVLRNDPQWDSLFATLNPNNQAWAGKAGALIAIASSQLAIKAGSPEMVPNGMHAFDTGAAWAYMAMQAHLLGFALHGIGGFNKEVGAQVLNLPADHTLQMLATVGKRGDAATLPEGLRERELPNARKPLSALAKRGTF